MSDRHEFKVDEVIGSMTVLELMPKGYPHGFHYRIRCACGNERIKSATRLRESLRNGYMQCNVCTARANLMAIRNRTRAAAHAT
jgi:hypothetical protein